MSDKHKILIVDDEQRVLAAMRRRYRKKYDVVTADSGREAINKLEREGSFTVVISDLQMPGMNGLEFLSMVRDISPDSICIMLTGFAELDAAVQAVNQGHIFRFLTKPCGNDVVDEAIDEAVKEYRKLTTTRSYTYSMHVVDGVPGKCERSSGCVALTGYSNQDFYADDELWIKAVRPDFRDAVAMMRDDVINRRDVKPLEFQIEKKDGSVRWVRETILPHYGEGGEVEALEGYVEDITEKKDLQRKLIASEARYQKLVENSPGLVFQMVMRQGQAVRFSFIGESCLDLLGLEPEAVMQDSNVFLERLEVQDRAEFVRLLKESAVRCKPWEWWGSGVFKSEKRSFQGVARPEVDDKGDVCWDGLLTDMTHLREVELKLRSVAKLAAENPNPVMRIDDENVITYANNASEELLGLWGCSEGDEVPGDVIDCMYNIRANNKNECIEKEWGGRVFSVVFAPVSEGDYVNIYARDITEVKMAERKLIEANERLREFDRIKNEFVSTVSHELRTPLCIFKNITSNALAGVMGRISKKLRKNLEMADEIIDRLSRVVGDFLDISKIEAGAVELDREVFDLAELVRRVTDAFEAVAEDYGVRLDVTSPDQKCLVHADSDRVSQVITNLLSNAVKFSPEGGTIRVSASINDDEVEIAVQDSGPGLSRDDMERVFERFVQVGDDRSKKGLGTGLGLPISRELVEMHGGKLWADSVVGEGSCFRFVLPLYLQKSENTKDEPQTSIRLPGRDV
ncbi:Sensor histidine kinase YycG [Anaerohalosphaera lusitana]|uniref:histidine kinase n=1 Tax=Anaerohalosphaera lusitana TaxID=1936003 RepID=A0A1U9NLK8_9BACT|nr:ATP-binding protein [Anaerohalosphaera lusitana]AQT68687.1 Sensor histidine kinase YycG [Anaerohalosphaera lusitana]